MAIDPITGLETDPNRQLASLPTTPNPLMGSIFSPSPFMSQGSVVGNPNWGSNQQMLYGGQPSIMTNPSVGVNTTGSAVNGVQPLLSPTGQLRNPYHVPTIQSPAQMNATKEAEVELANALLATTNPTNTGSGLPFGLTGSDVVTGATGLVGGILGYNAMQDEIALGQDKLQLSRDQFNAAQDRRDAINNNAKQF